jgi:peroxiredoxin
MYQTLKPILAPSISHDPLSSQTHSAFTLMKKILLFIYFIYSVFPSYGQSIKGQLSLIPNQSISLEGFNGLKTYPISSTTTDQNGHFRLDFSKDDYGIGYIIASDNKPLFIILSPEDVVLKGEALSYTETIIITTGQENLWFEQYAKEQPKREQALSAWTYLENIYQLDPQFSKQEPTVNYIQEEKNRILTESENFINSLPSNSYAKWFLPTRQLVSSVSSVAQYRSNEIPKLIASFRNLDYTDHRLYKSGLFKDAIERHFWLLENSGKPLDSVYVEMNISIDAMMSYLIHDEKKLNEVVDFLFDLLERRSLFQSSEYLALKVLNEISCTLESDLAKQLESYRAMKKGNVAPDIDLTNHSYINGIKQTQFKSLENLKKTYNLIIFGAGDCPKCIEELPQLRQNYQKWRKWGVEIVYISLDTDKTIFEKNAKSNPFITYTDFKKWESPVTKNYFVFGTPTMFLLNSKREILLRPHSIKQMDAWVDWFLIQGNK